MRAICTSAPLQASTRVSPGFTLFRHSSPPFGSKQAHSNSTHEGPVGVGHVTVHTTGLRLPFSTREVLEINIFPLARLFDSLVRVSRRVKTPHSHVARVTRISREGTRARRCRCAQPCSHHQYPNDMHLITARILPLTDNAHGLVLANRMEALSLSLSRFQVLCHSLSKVLFKLSLTLLVRYRSSCSVFNFGRHIPAD